MYPQQPNQPQGGYPPQTPPSSPGPSAMPNPLEQGPQPGRHYSPMPNYSPMSSPPLPPPQPLQIPPAQPPAQAPQPQHQPTPQAPPDQPPAGWYTPPATASADENKPASVDTYLQQAVPVAPMSGPTGPVPPGQKIHGQYAVDYLGGIAPSSETDSISIGGKRLSKKVFLIAVGGTVALLLTAMLLLFAPSPKKSNSLTSSSLYANMIDTADITKSAKKSIKSSQLRETNSSLNILLTGSVKQMETPLEKTGVDFQKVSTEAKKPPIKDEKLRAKLEDARLLGTYDRVYANEMQLRVNTMLIAMKSIKKQSSSPSMQEFVDNSIPEYEKVKKSIEDVQKSANIR